MTHLTSHLLKRQLIHNKKWNSKNLYRGGADPFEKVMVLVKKMMAAVGSPHSRAAEDTLMQASSQCGEEELERSNMTLLRCWS
uniref:Uncharacterized protein n=1 Tax=Oryza nivara TaxID=4536 RepID=A0A0E0J185_ORYNI